MIYQELIDQNNKLAVIGLGYVGLPIALEFAKKIEVIGFDINAARIAQMQKGQDPSRELESSAFEGCNITFTNELDVLKQAQFYIVAVPTPIDSSNLPDLKPLLAASRTVGQVLKKGDYVVFESTVYPGCTEEDCIPILEEVSGLKFKEDFKVGYSPERINPGDKQHTLQNVIKIVSGSCPESLEQIAKVYELVVEAGVHRAPSIKVAEAAKSIENAQRDINISFVNELALIFDKMNIDTNEVLEAASTKWNFLPFKPGLVGGHCIGVDPYYLANKAQELGYHPEIILAGRRMNDSMSTFIAFEIVKITLDKKIKIKNSKLLLLGITFKENCNDIRNTKVVDLYKALVNFGFKVDVYDPLADKDEVKHEYGIQLLSNLPETQKYHAAVLAVKHDVFKSFNPTLYLKKKSVVYDIKSYLTCEVDKKL